MSDPTEHRDPLEDSLGELRRMEDAGLFAATRVDAERLVRPRPAGEVPFFASWRKFRLPAVACLALFACATVILFRREMKSDAVRQAMVAQNDNGSADASSVAFNDCLAGPTGGIGSGCAAHDYDRDGDIDLQDFMSYQIAFKN